MFELWNAIKIVSCYDSRQSVLNANKKIMRKCFVQMVIIMSLKIDFQFYQVTAADDGTATEFSPQVSATCKGNLMNINVVFNSSYTGAIHARGNRKSPQCMQFGDGSNAVNLVLNLHPRLNSSDDCGILVHNVNGEVRIFINFSFLKQIIIRVFSHAWFLLMRWFIVWKIEKTYCESMLLIRSVCNKCNQFN